MNPRIPTTLLAISLFVAPALSQIAYSDSTPYEPKALGKPDKSSKGYKKLDAEKPVQGVEVNDSIKIPISIFDRDDSPVGDIAKSDVTVFVDGVEVAVDSLEKQGPHLNVVLVLDTSPSAIQRLDAIKQHALELMKALPQTTRVMVVEFHADMNILSQMTAQRTETEKAIKKAKMGDGTSIYSTVSTLFQKVFPLVPGQKNVVLLTDGVDTTSRKASYASSLAEVERSDVTVYPVLYETMNDHARASTQMPDWLAIILGQRVGVPPQARPGATARENQVGKDYLSDLARASGGRVFAGDKFDERSRSLAAELQGKYYATITRPKGQAAGRRQLKVRINRPRLKVHARGSFIE